ncbi:MAG: efflux RND transporter permease subunit [Alphaproteobacteria bacterium]
MFEFFIRRPILSCVLSVVIVLVGLACLLKLPVDIFPPIAPPTVFVSTSYPSASAETLSKTVASPVEAQINGVENMLYMVTNNTNTGDMTTTITFDIGTDTDMNLVNTRNRVGLAEPKLPADVKAIGLKINKKSTSMLQIVTFQSPDQSMNMVDITSYVDVNVLDTIKRIPGVGDAQIINPLNAIRIWLDTNKLGKLSLSVSDVIQAVREQNNQYATGRIGVPPVPSLMEKSYGIVSKGRLESPEEFEQIVLKASANGEIIRLKDVGRAELGSQNYEFAGKLNGVPTLILATYLQPGSNALTVAHLIRETVAELSKGLPSGITCEIPYDTTKFIEVSVKEVVHTLFEAVALVFLVVFLFLQNWRATVIPILAVPICLIGALIGLAALGFSINTLTLFGMVLSIGIVVDDAIVVVENVERLMHEEHLSPLQASIKAMQEVGGPVIAIVLILCAVFVPVGFLGGLLGQLYKQFAITIAISVVFSGIVALTLSPALSALLLKKAPSTPNRFFQIFNAGFDRVHRAYTHGVEYFIKKPLLGLIGFGCVILACGFLGKMIPTSLVPEEDQGYLIMVAGTPPGTAIQKIEAITEQLETLVRQHPAVDYVTSLGGFDLISGQKNPSNATVFIVLKDWKDRKTAALKAPAVQAELSKKIAVIQDAKVFLFNPPTIQGLGSVAGFEFYLEDRGNRSIQEIEAVAQAFIQASQKHPAIAHLSTTLQTVLPQYMANVDREKAKSLGIPLDQIFATLASYYGGYYVNDFSKSGRVYQVQIQSDAPHRLAADDLKHMYVRSNTTQTMIPLSAVLTFTPSTGPVMVNHFNGSVSAYLNGMGAPGYSSGQSLQAIEEIAKDVLPEDMKLSWTGAAFQEKKTGYQSLFAIGFGLVMVVLILAALYEKLLLPISVLCAIPFGVLGALLAVFFAGLTNDIYFQIGLLTLVGLSAKNSILIVEFAIIKRAEGLSIVEAAIEAARLRFRPILMTSLAFILGAVPLVLSSGAGANGRHSIGTGLIGGMVLASSLALFFIPLFYVLFQRLSEFMQKNLKSKETNHAKVNLPQS